jgi:hypothetical protein
LLAPTWLRYGDIYFLGAYLIGSLFWALQGGERDNVRMERPYLLKDIMLLE